MAKKQHKTPKYDSSVQYQGKTPYGSHKEMVVEDLGNGLLRLEDEKGCYITSKDRLDSGLADPNRWSRT